MKTKIILGLGYGDEGKGLITDYLCQRSIHPCVIRFSGGHQAGHTVVTKNNERHVFSSFGAGTLRGVPTYWSKYCTFYPIHFFNELAALLEKDIQPIIYVDAMAMVTTPYDVFYNRNTEKINQHGSCGLGVGATMTRNVSSPVKLYVKDLFYPVVLKNKMEAIHKYYQQKTNSKYIFGDLTKMLDLFYKMNQDILPYIILVQEKEFFSTILHREKISEFIFEGSQGILLDMDHGFFPNVTYASTTSKNAMELIDKYNLSKPEIFYITRFYQTRHGNGFLSHEHETLKYLPNPNETNQFNIWQGIQRCSILDLELLEYALQTDKEFSHGCKKHLVVTCLDQLIGKIKAARNSKVGEYENVSDLAQELNIHFDSYLESRGETSSTVSSFCPNTSVVLE